MGPNNGRILSHLRGAFDRHASLLDVLDVLAASRVRTERGGHKRQRVAHAIVAHLPHRVGQQRVPVPIAPINRQRNTLPQRRNQRAILIVDGTAAVEVIIVVLGDFKHPLPRNVAAAQHVFKKRNHLFVFFSGLPNETISSFRIVWIHILILRIRHTFGCSRTKLCKLGSMEREQVIAALKAHEQELRTAGVLSVSLFGSVARGEASAHDVDVAVRLGHNFSTPGLNYFSRLADLEGRLSGILGYKVDVIEEPARNVSKLKSNGFAPLPSGQAGPPP